MSGAGNMTGSPKLKEAEQDIGGAEYTTLQYLTLGLILKKGWNY